jgi:uncharacterized protein YdhG (YjbR/CyaY superfamily)
MGRKRAASARETGPEGARAVDAYLASVPVESRKALEKLRYTIRGAAPGAEEGFSYGLPAFRLDGRPLVCYAAWKAHCSFYPMSAAALRAHAEALEGYDLSKGTVRFSPDTPLPAALVRTLVKERMAQLRARTE